jgi:hypothetical protein
MPKLALELERRRLERIAGRKLERQLVHAADVRCIGGTLEIDTPREEIVVAQLEQHALDRIALSRCLDTTSKSRKGISRRRARRTHLGTGSSRPFEQRARSSSLEKNV